MGHHLFSFGTLRQPDVQQSLFGRRVPSAPDAIVGYRVRKVQITDPAAIVASGADVHPALVETGDPGDVLNGEVLELSDDEPAAAHRYDEVSFRRFEVQTVAGVRALAYVPKEGLTLAD